MSSHRDRRRPTLEKNKTTTILNFKMESFLFAIEIVANFSILYFFKLIYILVDIMIFMIKSINKSHIEALFRALCDGTICVRFLLGFAYN